MGQRPHEHPTPKAFFSADHRECDTLWTRVESAIESKDPAGIAASWAAFDTAMRRHFSMEEQVLFPAVESAMGMPPDGGPTAVMRSEHDQMRGVLDAMNQSLESGNVQDVLDHGDTLHILVQQHNVKEESVLYPMCDEALGANWTKLADTLDRY